MSGETKKSLKKLICAGIVTLALTGCQKEARATLAETYFPLNVGNSWTYTNYVGDPIVDPGHPDWTSPRPGSELTFTIIGTEEIDGHTYYKFDNYFYVGPPPPNGDWPIVVRNVLFRYNSIANTILTYRSIGEDIIRYNFTGGEWNAGWLGLCRLKSDNVICSVPAGEFSDCLNFQFGYFPYIGPDAAAFGEYLAPSVGVIKFVRPGGDYPDRLEGQDVTFMLKSYTIIPEPSMLLLLGLGGLLLRKRN